MPEIEFAQGNTVPTQNIRVTYACLTEMDPGAKFPTIYRTNDDGSVIKMPLTPEQGRYLRDVLGILFK